MPPTPRVNIKLFEIFLNLIYIYIYLFFTAQKGNIDAPVADNEPFPLVAIVVADNDAVVAVDFATKMQLMMKKRWLLQQEGKVNSSL